MKNIKELSDMENKIKKVYIYLIRILDEDNRIREREGEKEGEKHQCVVASHMPPTADPQPRHVP